MPASPAPERSPCPPQALSAGRRAARLVLRTDLFVACGVGSLGAWVGEAVGEPVSVLALSTLICGTLVVYNLDHWRDERGAGPADPARPHLHRALRFALLAFGSLGLSWSFASDPQLLVRALPAGVVGLLYGARAPSGARLKDIPGAKAWIVALAVTQACLFVPLGAPAATPGAAAIAGFVLTLTALNAHCFDLRDVRLDEAAGTPSWVSRRGAARSHRLLVAAAALAVLAASGAWLLGWAPLSAPISVALAGLSLRWVRPGAHPERFGLLVDGWLWLPAVVSLALSAL